MRAVILALAIFGVASSGSAQPFPGLPERLTFPSGDLTMAKVEEMETILLPPPGSGPLSRYDRYYTLETRNGHPVVVGLLLLRAQTASAGSALIAPESQWIQVADGGCSVIHLLWEPSRGPELVCNGVP